MTARKIAIMLCTFLSVFTLNVFAGAISTLRVVIDDTARSAMGVFRTVRNTSDMVQYHYCGLISVGAAPSLVLQCVSQDVTGMQRRCTTVNANLIEMYKGMGDDGYLQFRWDANGQCTYMQTAKGSPFGAREQ